MLPLFRKLGARFTNLIKDLRLSRKDKFMKFRSREEKARENVRVL